MKEKLEDIKNSFYGWEYAVKHNLQPEITYGEIVLLDSIFDDVEELLKVVETLRLDNTYLQQRLKREVEKK